MRKLDTFVPNELSYSTYKKRFHALIYLEEVEMKASFEKYKAREVWIEPEKIGKKKRFSIMCSKITELRPPIAVGGFFLQFFLRINETRFYLIKNPRKWNNISIRKIVCFYIGDRIEVRNSKKPQRYYRGIVERVREDRFILRFRRDFELDWKVGSAYEAEFFYSRTIYQRKHAAVDYAKRKLNESFLFPTKLTLAKKLQLNAEVKENKLLLDDKEVPLYNDNLNEEQKFAVAAALR